MNDRTDALPPHSLEAEQSVLGAIMLNNDEAAAVMGWPLAAEHFYSDAHRVIFKAMDTLRASHAPIDVTTLSNALDATGKLDYVGGIAYLGALVANVPTAKHIEHYATIVREKAECRRLAADAIRLHDAALNPMGRASSEILAEWRTTLPNSVSTTTPDPIGSDEFETARASPDCIVEDYLFADVGVVIAPGGTGKTTLLLFEAIHIVLGRPVYGRRIDKPGPVLIVTAEDSREMLVARLRHICAALELTPEQVATVRASVRIKDVCGKGFKLTRVVDDVVVASANVDTVMEWGVEVGAVLVSLDPAIAFSIGEARVNDAEQGLIEVGRRIRAALNACVRFVHHSGKVNAREKTLDQYTGRGGSAFADGARMVAVLQPLTADEWRAAAGSSLVDGEQGMVLALPKLSYRPPAPDILITRKGYAFAHTNRPDVDPAGDLKANCEQVLQVIRNDLDGGIRHTQRSLEALKFMPRNDLRDAVSTLIARRALEHSDMPDKPQRGAKTYLRPVAAPSSDGASKQ